MLALQCDFVIDWQSKRAYLALEGRSVRAWIYCVEMFALKLLLHLLLRQYFTGLIGIDLTLFGCCKFNHLYLTYLYLILSYYIHQLLHYVSLHANNKPSIIMHPQWINPAYFIEQSQICKVFKYLWQLAIVAIVFLVTLSMPTILHLLYSIYYTIYCLNLKYDCSQNCTYFYNCWHSSPSLFISPIRAQMREMLVYKLRAVCMSDRPRSQESFIWDWKMEASCGWSWLWIVSDFYSSGWLMFKLLLLLLMLLCMLYGFVYELVYINQLTVSMTYYYIIVIVIVRACTAIIVFQQIPHMLPSQPASKYKPIDETTLKSKLSLSQTRTQQIFNQPFKYFSTLLTVATYVQCLKYCLDAYAGSWFDTAPTNIVGYIDFSTYSRNLPSTATSIIAILYSLCSVLMVLVEGKVRKKLVYVIMKALQMGFSTVLFMWVAGNCCYAIQAYFNNSGSQNYISVSLAFVALILFSVVVCLQTFTRFDFIATTPNSGTIRKSNWSGVTLLIYITINQLAVNLSTPDTMAHLIIMSLALVFHTFIFFLKFQLEQQIPTRVEMSCIAVNLLAVAILLAIKVLSVQLDIGFLIILSIIAIFSLSQLHYFNIVFELENVNKWTNSQIMISYAAKLRKILLNYDDNYYNTLFLGYVEIHQQKCDNEMCPLKNMGAKDQMKKRRFEDIIKKIYNDGCKLTPVNPELLLEYAIFHYEVGAKDKSMKILLEIKQTELSLDKYYKFSRLKQTMHRQIMEMPEQDFLDLFSQIKVKDLQERIIKKFEEAALISLQFWSILNEDHPDFRKLYEVGKSKVAISQQAHSLYKQITQIAHSERVTGLFIHYLNQIENEQRLFSELEDEIKNLPGFDAKIVIEDWKNSCSPVLIVSIEEQNLGAIIDLNTTCASMLGYQKFDLLGRDIKTIFPGILANQIETFMDVKHFKQSENTFFVGHSNGYIIKITRKIQSFNSVETGVSLIITFEHRFAQNQCFLIFNNELKLMTMSSSCLQFLNFQPSILEVQNLYEDLFSKPIAQINEEKTIVKLEAILRQNKSDVDKQQKNKDCKNERLFNIFKKAQNNFVVLYFNLLKTIKVAQSSLNFDESGDIGRKFKFEISNQNSDFFFIGCSDANQRDSVIEQNFSMIEANDKNQSKGSKDYAQNITTLRLHENYIKVIEQSEGEPEDQGEIASQTSTNNQLMTDQKVARISKADEDKIFENRETYHNFVDKNIKKIHIRTGLAVSILICMALYIGFYFGIKNNYTSIYTMYKRLAFGKLVVGQIAEANRIIVQTKYRSRAPSPQTDYLLSQNYADTLDSLQALIKSYTLPYMMDVYLSPDNVHQFRSDQFILAFISQFSKVKTQVETTGFNAPPLNTSSSWFIEFNGNVSKKIMNTHALKFKNEARDFSTNGLNFVIFINCGGFVLSILLTAFILYANRKINVYKVQILSIFLQTTQKDIQTYSQKTEQFLITLHVDQSNQANEPVQETFDTKKGSSAMFAKKKRFKKTSFSKFSYFVLSSFFLISTAYYIHFFSFSLQKNIFIMDAIDYFEIVSDYIDRFAVSQSKIYKKLDENYNPNSTTRVSLPSFIGEINTDILTYQRDYFTCHYNTYGSIDSYHQKFATVFMRDICNGSIQVPHACEAGIMAQNGTLLMITDVTVQNEQIDFSKVLDPKYYISVEVIKQAHKYLHDQVVQVSDEYFNGIYNSVLFILLLWVVVLIISGLGLEYFVQKVIVRDVYLVKCMLKFFPVSFARKSQGVNKFIADILEQQGPFK